jgi:hypothetical protein
MSDDLSGESLSVFEMRSKAIDLLNACKSKASTSWEMGDLLFNLGLTMYSGNATFDSAIYNAFSSSKLDENIALHPEEAHIIELIKEKSALIVSAPTSFGKTFCIFEYIARYQPKKVVLVVPTLALANEYIQKIVRKYKASFSDYQVRPFIGKETPENPNEKIIWILTHEKVIANEDYKSLGKVDFLVIDEVYKLSRSNADNRVLVMNLAYLQLAKQAEKYVLLAPFIRDVINKEKLPASPFFYHTDYAPVNNNVIPVDIFSDSERYPTCFRILQRQCKNTKTMAYFPRPSSIYHFVSDYVRKLPDINLPDSARRFLAWAKEEVSDRWSVVLAMEKGFLVHTGQIPPSTRNFESSLFNKKGSGFDTILCTSTLLEGVNSPAENLIITFPSRTTDDYSDPNYFSAFDFFNLVGRTGRLFEHLVGNAYYLKAPNDPVFDRKKAMASIEFEATEATEDMMIQSGKDLPEAVTNYFNSVGITAEEYKTNVGPSMRLSTFKSAFEMYQKKKEDLITSIEGLDGLAPGPSLFRTIMDVCIVGKINAPSPAISSSIILSLTRSHWPSTKEVVNSIMNKKIHPETIDEAIGDVMRMRSGLLENAFLNAAKLIHFLLLHDNIDKHFVASFDDAVINPVNRMFFADSSQKHMLIDLGVYDRDVEFICSVVGDSFTDAFQFVRLIKDKIELIKDQISYVSYYQIVSLIN